MKSKLIITNGIALFIGRVSDNISHQHHAIQLTFDIEERFAVKLGNISISSRAILINSDVKHKIFSNRGKQVLMLIEPESDYGTAIRNKISADKNGALNLDDRLDSRLLSSLEELFFSEEVFIDKVMATVMDLLGIHASNAYVIDQRIRAISDIINHNRIKDFSISVLADGVGLSESRLQHLFKEQIGIPIKRYILWKKMMAAVSLITGNNDFTTAAYEAGFSDSAHISRTFKKNFGLTLSDIFKNSSAVQVSVQEIKYNKINK